MAIRNSVGEELGLCKDGSGCTVGSVAQVLDLPVELYWVYIDHQRFSGDGIEN